MPDITAKHPSWMVHEALELKATAGWRRQKANRYPVAVDIRNAKAVELLTRLADEVPKLAGSRRAEVFEAFHDFIFSGSQAENPGTVIRRWSEYRAGIGFENFPQTAADYIDALMEIARNVP